VGSREAQATINVLRDRYTKISEAAGLREQPERAAVGGFRAVKTADQLKNPRNMVYLLQAHLMATAKRH